MPMYTFECPQCGYFEEHLLTLHVRDSVVIDCPECDNVMRRIMDKPVIGKPAYQMQAVLNNGRHVAGHFGKAAKKK